MSKTITFAVASIQFMLAHYTPRNNEYEKGLKYELFICYEDGIKHSTGYKFETIKLAKEWAKKNAFTLYA